MIVDGRNAGARSSTGGAPVRRGRAAGARRVHRVWTAPTTPTPSRARAARGLARPPGRRRRGRPLSLRRRGRAARRPTTRWSSRSTRSRTRRTSARSAARPRRPGRPGVVIPERRSAEVTAAVCKASAGAVEHLPVARVRNLADWLAEAKDAGAWVYGADAGRPDAPTRPSTDAARSCSCSAARAGACARGSPSACDELVALPLRGQGRLAQRLRRGRRAAVRGGSSAAR